jgi:uncharacterized protein YecE (DUF72 family)
VARLTADHLTSPPKPWRRSDLRIGISGWTYPPWRGVFYPKKLPHRKAKIGKRDVYLYFDNDAKVHAPFNAKTLTKKLQPQGAAI